MHDTAFDKNTKDNLKKDLLKSYEKADNPAIFSDEYKRNKKAVIHVGYYTKQVIDIQPISSKEIELQLYLDDEVLKLPSDLIHIYNEIELSKYIIKLEEGWDENEAPVIPNKIWKAATKLLAKYALFIRNNYSLIIEAPEINPCPNGTIDLSWRTKNARMLMNIKNSNNNIIANFYGDYYDCVEPRKGTVSIESVKEDLAVWMKTLAQ